MKNERQNPELVEGKPQPLLEQLVEEVKAKFLENTHKADGMNNDLYTFEKVKNLFSAASDVVASHGNPITLAIDLIDQTMLSAKEVITTSAEVLPDTDSEESWNLFFKHVAEDILIIEIGNRYPELIEERRSKQ